MKYIYINTLLLFCLLATLAACDFAAHSDMEEREAGGKVYLTISIGKDHQPTVNFTKAGSTLKSGSINTDDMLLEDRVRELMIYIFNSDGTPAPNGKQYKSGIKLGDPVSFLVELPEGTYDFYFIANMPDVTFSNKAAIESYLKELRELPETLFTGPKKDADGQPLFPMARVYRNQVIKVGNGSSGTIDNPIYFRPINDDGVAEDNVLLNRVVAKVEVKITGFLETSSIHRIALMNGVKQFSLITLPDNEGKEENDYPGFTKPDGYSNYLIYVPEVIQTNPDQLAWSESAPLVEDILLITIETNGAEDYLIPVVSNYKTEKGDYLDFASGKGTEKPNFNLLRNYHYFFTLNITRGSEVEVYLEVKPFESVEIGHGGFYPGIVNVDRKTVTLNDTSKGTLFFNFVSSDVDASDYMEFVGASGSENISDSHYPAQVAKVTPVAGRKGYFQLDLDFSSSGEPEAFYLHFKNTKSKNVSDANITIKIIVGEQVLE